MKMYDVELLRISNDHRRTVSEYELMLLGKDGPRYFKVESTGSQREDMLKLYKAIQDQIIEDNND